MAQQKQQRSLGEILQEFAQHRQLMQQELQKVIVGQDEVIEQLFAAIFTRGHCLLEGVPGLAKTLMVSTLARILDIQFKRIQFTPDLMPSDITGTNVLEEDDARHGGTFVSWKGRSLPISCWPTKSTARRPRHRPPSYRRCRSAKFPSAAQPTICRSRSFTIATQNPIEQEGTYPLPEAQLDRFMFNIKVDYPTLRRRGADSGGSTSRQDKIEVNKVLSAKAILNVQKLVGIRGRQRVHHQIRRPARSRHAAQG